MKIGDVAKRYEISVDTINYYVNYGLLVPPKKGGQRDFDEKTQADLEMVIELKKLNFTLNEIHRVITLYRISGLASAQDVGELIEIYRNKRLACIRESEYLTEAAAILKRKSDALQAHRRPTQSKIGLPLRMLDLLCCPRCRGEMEITDAKMNLRYIFSAMLICDCGYRAEVRDGILLTPNKNMDVYDTPDVDRNMYKHLPPSLISLFQSSYNWMLDRLGEMGSDGKVVLETYVNAWFFLHNHQQYLHPKGRYVIADKYPETLLAYKEIIEKQDAGLDILYIADSSTNLPLRPRSVDINVDFFAVNEHNFYHRSFLLDRLRPYFADNAALLGTFFFFQNGVKSMPRLLREYPSCAEYNFNVQYFLRALDEGNFEILKKKDVGYTTDSGENIGFSFHVTGEEMHLLSYLAKNFAGFAAMDEPAKFT